MQEELLDDQFKEEEYPNAQDYDHSLHGLNGWLAFLGFSLIASMVLTAVGNFKNYATIFRQFSLFEPKFKFWLGVEFILILGVFIMQIVVLINYFGKKKLFPKLFLIYLGIYLAVSLFDNLVIVKVLSGEFAIAGIIRPVIYALVWGLYITNSKQVNHTFLYK